MRSGDRPGLQNRRSLSRDSDDGFDSHSLPPFVFMRLALSAFAQRDHSAKSGHRDKNAIKIPWILTGNTPSVGSSIDGIRCEISVLPSGVHRFEARMLVGSACLRNPLGGQRSSRLRHTGSQDLQMSNADRTRVDLPIPLSFAAVHHPIAA